MGTVCSIVRNGIDYLLRYFLPRYASYFTRGYNNVIEKYTPRRYADNTRERDKLLTNGKDQGFSVNTEQGQNANVSHHENFGNIAFLRGVIRNFFENYNFQLQVLNGRPNENNRSIKNKHCKETNRSDRVNDNRQDLKSCTVPNGRFEQLCLDIRRDDVNSGSEDVKVNEADRKPKVEVKGRFHLFKIRDDANIRTREHIHGTEQYGHSDKIVKININSDENGSSDQRRWDSVATDENTRQEKIFSRTSSLVNQKFINGLSTDNNLNDETKHDIQKISLFRMHSGCHFSVDEGNQSVQLSNYSTESVPLRIPDLTHKEILHKELFSGGMVASEEFSKHLAIPNYYSENPIIYHEPSAGVEFSRSSPEKLLPHLQLPLRPTSCSGGGIVPQDTQTVTLPDFFPERDPLLRPVAIQISTQSSASSGGLISSDNDTIFSDLIFESLRFDALNASQVPHKENFDQEAARRASDSEILTSPSKGKITRSKLESV